MLLYAVKTGPSVTDAAMARLAQGTKVLTEGGQDKVFQHTFATHPGEKLLNAYACHLSTSSGPVIGTLYLSTEKLAFCSDNPLCHYTPSGLQEWIYYKVFPFFVHAHAVCVTLYFQESIGSVGGIGMLLSFPSEVHNHVSFDAVLSP